MDEMTLERIEQKFIPYLQVELPHSQMLEVRRHLEADPESRRRIRDMELTLRLLRRAFGERPERIPSRHLVCENAKNDLRPS